MNLADDMRKMKYAFMTSCQRVQVHSMTYYPEANLAGLDVVDFHDCSILISIFFFPYVIVPKQIIHSVG